ncbi:hypothetical protein LWI29_010546 [Acer saccharum]|uniref:Mitochondrial adenine nucleotide transporter BTL3 n=1 Tax=Acer saccharum TaxID=4024 RepID=A0AA39W950_ACESA|nr:hypothetical protein LWI29_010546 [Acer saccharum]
MHRQDLSFTDLIKSHPSGGLFLERTVPPSFVSLIFTKNNDSSSSSPASKTLRFVRRRGGFLSVSLSIKEGSEGYVGESRESWGQNGNDNNNKTSREEEEKNDEQETVSFKVEKVREKESGAFNTTKHLFAGAISAAVSRTFVAPLERLKLEYIVRGEQKHLFDLIKTIAVSQGIKGFWKGNFVNILRTAPFKAINFYAYDTYRSQLLKITRNEETTNFERFVAGAAAGITATCLCLPMDTIRTVMVAPGGEVLGGVIGVFRHMIRTEGEEETSYMKQEGQELNALEQLELGPVRTLLYGAIAGACAEAATYPFEVVRRQLQLQVRATKLSALATCVKIVEQGGVPALYAGLVPSLLQVLPSASISYFVYEFMKIVLKVESS